MTGYDIPEPPPRTRGSVLGCIAVVLLFGIAIVGVLRLWSHFTVEVPVSTALSSDARNVGINLDAHFRAHVNPGVLVVDLKSVAAGKTNSDVTRALLEVAAAMKNRRFRVVELAYRGESRFVIRGPFFAQLGSSYAGEDPIGAAGDLPRNLYDLSGKRPYVIGVGAFAETVEQQRANLNDFHRRWYGGMPASTAQISVAAAPAAETATLLDATATMKDARSPGAGAAETSTAAASPGARASAQASREAKKETAITPTTTTTTTPVPPVDRRAEANEASLRAIVEQHRKANEVFVDLSRRVYFTTRCTSAGFAAQVPMTRSVAEVQGYRNGGECPQ